MKINNNYAKFLRSLKKTENKNNVLDKKTAEAIKPAGKKSVEINISKEARELAELSKNEAHNERINEIKNAIKNGQYEIDPKGIAEGISNVIRSQKGME